MTIRRRSIRLKDYDYTRAGAYFVTICTRNRQPFFGEIIKDEMRTSTFGEIVHHEWFRTAEIRPRVRLNKDEFVVMPNHIHGIVWVLEGDVGARRRRAPTMEQFGKPVPGSIPSIIRSFKSACTRSINILNKTSGTSIRQRNYYEHIIRTETSLNEIRRYIQDNPACWQFDRYNPETCGDDPLTHDVWENHKRDAETGVTPLMKIPTKE